MAVCDPKCAATGTRKERPRCCRGICPWQHDCSWQRGARESPSPSRPRATFCGFYSEQSPDSRWTPSRGTSWPRYKAPSGRSGGPPNRSASQCPAPAKQLIGPPVDPTAGATRLNQPPNRGKNPSHRETKRDHIPPHRLKRPPTAPNYRCFREPKPATTAPPQSASQSPRERLQSATE